ncbi:MAG: STAS domain-containing protein [Spirochaetes bacterium]|nr:STAS domain-containing protein [Spirochaetota bacterium]
MNIRVKSTVGITIVYLSGRLDIFESESAEMDLIDIADEYPENHIVIVLEKLDYLSSSGLRIFISLKRYLDNRGKRLVLCNDRNNAVNIFFKIINIGQMFDIFRSEEQAVLSIANGKKSKAGRVA